jgi:hypothetical protein
MLHYQRLGTSQSKDQLILWAKESPHERYWAEMSKDGNWFIVSMLSIRFNNKIWVARMGTNKRVLKRLDFTKLIDHFDNFYYP